MAKAICGWRTKGWTVWKQISSISMQKKAQCRNTLHPMFTAYLNTSVCWYINNSLEVTTNPKSINSRRRLAGYFKSFSTQVWWSARLEDFKVSFSLKSFQLPPNSQYSMLLLIVFVEPSWLVHQILTLF